MRASYVQIWDDEAGRYVLVPRGEYVPQRERTHLVMPDLPDYTSPIDGRLVSGRVARREDLKRHGCRPYEKGEREDAQRRTRDFDRQLERSIFQTAQEVANG